MEIFELRYFLGVAEAENIHRASEKLRISPASLSKAIGRLEDELAVRLFSREGRNIRLTDHGRLLQRRAAEIVRREEDARIEVGGHAGALHVVVAGAEILLSKMGLALAEKVKARFPAATFEFRAADDETTVERVLRGEAHFGIVTSEPAKDADLAAKTIGEAKFQTFVGEGHPLFAAARANRVIPVEEVLKHAFVSPSNPLLGEVGRKQSLDGWRDDRFPRRVEYRTSSLKILEEFVATGRAIAYLPDYYGENTGLRVLRVSGCPYTCEQRVRLVAKNPKDVSWMNQVF